MELLVVTAMLALSIGLGLATCRVMLAAVVFAMAPNAFIARTAPFESPLYEENTVRLVAPAA